MEVMRRPEKALRLSCDDPQDEFVVRYDNRGDPYREGIVIGIENRDFSKEVTVMLEDREALALRDFLNCQYPLNSKVSL